MKKQATRKLSAKICGLTLFSCAKMTSVRQICLEGEMFMKKILSLLMIILTVSFTALASPLSISEGNVDELTLYAPDGTILDPTSDIGETGMVIRTGNEPAVFSSVYGDIELEGNSLLAVTDFTISSPSLYLVYGEVNVTLTENLPITVYTPASSVHLPGSGEYGLGNDIVFISNNLIWEMLILKYAH